jgi:hypothetical protein
MRRHPSVPACAQTSPAATAVSILELRHGPYYRPGLSVEPLRTLRARGEGVLDEALARGVQLALISLSARRRERERGLR